MHTGLDIREQAMNKVELDLEWVNIVQLEGQVMKSGHLDDQRV